MGFFRRHKADRYTTEEARKMVRLAKSRIVNLAKEFQYEALDSALEEWAAWRELLARKQGDNEGREE